MTTPALFGGEPVRREYLVFGEPDIQQPEIDEVVDVLRSRWIGTGPRTARFEEAACAYLGCPFARAVNSGTAALFLSMHVLGIGRGDEVITCPLTFGATVNSIVHSGATPVLVDCEPDTMCIDVAQIEDAITPRTRAILPIHMAGRACDMDAIGDIARRHSLFVIEDAAHAIETAYKGRKVGTISDLTCFSFYATKNVTTGEGGMVTTANEEWARRIEILALHGQSRGAWKRYSDDGFRHYEIVVPGFKYNMTDMQAAIGIHQLARVKDNLVRREEIWRRYDDAFGSLPLATPLPPEPDTVHARHLYTVFLDIDALGVSRDEFQEALHRENIGSGVHYRSVHLQDHYRRTCGYVVEDYPNAAWVSERTLSLPLGTRLSDDDVNDVITAVGKLCNYFTDRQKSSQ